MQIFAKFPGKGALKDNGVIENIDFQSFGRSTFGTLGNKASSANFSRSSLCSENCRGNYVVSFGFAIGRTA